MAPTTSLPPRQLLDHVGFRDWVATRAGFYFMPGGISLVAVALDRGGPLRITKPLSGDPLPLTIIEVLEKGRYVTGLDVARVIPALSLTKLRRRRGVRRLVLETELQRKRLLPRWLDWLRGAAEAEDAVLGLDLWALKHLRSASFAELAYMAGQLPSIGSRMVWALVRADAGRAVALFLHWVSSGEHTRLHGLGDTMIQIAEASVDSPYHAEYLRLLELVVAATTNAAAG
jgi:ABC-type transporter Mla MlaB component